MMRRTVKSLIGFHLGAADGEFGKVADFYFDDETWTLRYLVVTTGGWLLSRKVLISNAVLKEPDWNNEIIPVNLTREQIKNSPDIDTERTISRQQEIELVQPLRLAVLWHRRIGVLWWHGFIGHG
jgi:hypothetical protein